MEFVKENRRRKSTTSKPPSSGDFQNAPDIQSHDAQIFDLTAQLRAKRGLKFIDALHCATAIQAGCKFFVTNDGGIQSSDDLEVIVVRALVDAQIGAR